MRFGKLRPVGSKVPLPAQVDAVLPWEGQYVHEFTRSGTEALSLAVRLAIADHPDVDSPEVLVPAYGCPDLVAAVVAQGAIPVLVDLADHRAPFMDIEGAEAAITDNAVAIIAVGFLGLAERLGPLAALARKKGLLLIEDSAQCFPPRSIEKAGEEADLVVLSFGRGKPINLMGGGALLIRKDHESRFSSPRHDYPALSLKINLAWYLRRLVFNVLLSRLPYALMEKVPFLHLGETRLHLLGDICRLDIPSKLIAAGIDQYRQGSSLQGVYDAKLSFLDRYDWIRIRALHSDTEDLTNPSLRYALLAPDRRIRDRLVARLNEVGIAGSVFYGKPLPEIEGVSKYLALSGERGFPAAREFSSRLLTLPCHEGVTEQDVATILSCFSEEMAGIHAD